MQSYLLREDQLKMHGFARPTSDPGVASIVRKPDEIYDIQPVGSNGMYVNGGHACIIVCMHMLQKCCTCN